MCGLQHFPASLEGVFLLIMLKQKQTRQNQDWAKSKTSIVKKPTAKRLLHIWSKPENWEISIMEYMMSFISYIQNFRVGVSFRGIWWSFVSGVRSLWRHNLKSYSCFQTNVVAKFVDIIYIFFCTHSPYFMFHYTEPIALQVRIWEEIRLNAATQQFITAKFSLRVEKGE